MTARVGREQAGNRVFEAMCDGDWTIAEGCEVTGLTRAQWHTGLAYIRDHAEPIVYDAKTHRYALAKFEVEVDRYIIARMKTFAIQLARIRNGTFTPARVKFETPGITRFRRVDDSVYRVFTDIGFVLEEMGDEMPAKVQAMMIRS